MVDLEHQPNKFRIDDRRGRPVLHEPNGVVRDPTQAELWMWAEINRLDELVEYLQENSTE